MSLSTGGSAAVLKLNVLIFNSVQRHYLTDTGHTNAKRSIQAKSKPNPILLLKIQSFISPQAYTGRTFSY